MTAPRSRSLGASASRGAAVTLGGQGLRVVVQLAGIMVLARLLSPTDYGLLAMVTAVIGIGELVRDFGLSSAAIQARTLTRGQKSNLFWINAAIGLVLSGAAVLASFPLANLYGDPRVQALTAVLASTFVINGLATQFRADLSRTLRFGRLVVVDTGAQLIGLGLGIGMAIALAGTGGEYWALAGQTVGQAVATLVLLVCLTGWMPGLARRREPMRGLLGFGINMLGVQALNYVSRNVDSVIVGARFGAADLGIYNKAFQLMMLPLLQLNNPASRVALPVLSRLQDERERYARFILFGQASMLTVLGAVLAVLGAQAEGVIRIMVGEQWLGAVPLFRILLIAGFFQAAGYASSWVFVSKGLMRQNLAYSLVTRPLMIGAIFVGSLWGVYGVAVAYSVSIALMWPLALWWLSRCSDAPVAAMARNGARAIVVFGAGCLVSYLATIGIDRALPFVHVLVGGAVILAWIGLVALIWPRFRRDVLDLLSARRFFRRGGGGGAPAAAAPDALHTAADADASTVVAADTADDATPADAAPALKGRV